MTKTIKLEKTHTDLGLLILRSTVAGLIFLHGIENLRGGYTFVKSMMANSGLPEFLAYGAFVGEIIAPILILVGYKTRISSLVIAWTMLVAIITTHAKDIFALNQFGGWAIELQAFYLFGAIAIFFAGAGRYTLVQSILK